MNKILLFTALFVLCHSLLFSQIMPDFANVDYVGDGDDRHLLDVYIPDNLTEPAPAVVYIHGGGWATGSKDGAIGFCGRLYNTGFVVIGINYRLSQDSIFPAQIYDCKTAIRFLKMHANEYMIDTCNIGVTGTSAGGHLVALLGTSNGESTLEGWHQGSTEASSDVHAVADFYGPVDFLQMDGFLPDSCVNPLVHEDENSPETRLLGCLITECPDRVAEANPITYINGNEPPFAIHHGGMDCSVPVHQSFLLRDALLANNQQATLTVYPEGGHGGFITPAVREAVRLFFDQYLINDCATVSSTGYHSNADSWEIFPNPSTTFISLKGNERPLIDLQFYSANGEKMLYHRNIQASEPIDISSLPTGLYLIMISQDGKPVGTQKMLKLP